MTINAGSNALLGNHWIAINPSGSIEHSTIYCLKIENGMGTGGEDAGNDFSTATGIDIDYVGIEYLDSIDTHDYYKVSVKSGRTLHVSMTPPSGSDFDLYLYYPNEVEAGRSEFEGSTPDWVRVTATKATAGDWYILVKHRSGGGTYLMESTLLPHLL